MNRKISENSRRDFIRKTSLGMASMAIGGIGLTQSSYSRILGANERINVAFIGCYRRFNGLMSSLPGLSELLNITYVCDVDQVRMNDAANKIKESMGNRPRLQEDLRKIMEDPEVDAVINATPDHWHVPATVMALRSGKHVYLEKPCSHNPHESELLVECQKKYDRVIQMGTQQRSAIESREVIQEIHNGLIGKPYLGLAFYTNSRGMVPVPQKVSPPKTLNWELFQGPAPREPYMNIYFDYNWHWFWQYGTAETGNNAVHELDICRWALQVDYPEKVIVSAAKQHFPEDGWQMYDTMDARFLFNNGTMIRWDGKSRTGYNTYGADRGSIIYGSGGTAFITRNGYRVFDLDGNITRERNAADRSQTTQMGGCGTLDSLHVMNFINTIRGKASIQHMPIDEGAKSTLLGHLANISYRAGSQLDIDSNTGQILNNNNAMKYWSRTYEKGWEPGI